MFNKFPNNFAFLILVCINLKRKEAIINKQFRACPTIIIPVKLKFYEPSLTFFENTLYMNLKSFSLSMMFIRIFKIG